MSSTANLNRSLRTLCTEGRLKEAVRILFNTNNAAVDSSTYIHLLHACIASKSLFEGKQIHSYINDRGLIFTPHTLLPNTLINLYDKCGSLLDARTVFDNMTEPNVFSWNVIILAYRKHGLLQEALKLFHQMQRTAIQPDHFTFSTIIPVCASMASPEHGLQIHGNVIRRGFLSNVIVMNTLIDLYAKRGSIGKAHELFDKMPQRDNVSWNAMIVGYKQNGIDEKSLDIFKQLQLAGVNPNSATFTSILPACAKMEALEEGMEIHQKIIKSGFSFDVVIVTTLIDMYAKCGSIRKAQNLFDTIRQQDVVSWTAIVAGYVQNGLVDKALEIFKQMQLTSIKPNALTFTSILSACAKLGDSEQGMEIHQKIIENRFVSDVRLLTALIDMYAKCGNLQKAYVLFDKIPQQDVVSWTAIIAGYAQNGFADKAFEVFKQMQLAGVKPTSETFASILPACAKMGALELGVVIHQQLIENNFLLDVKVVTALIDMYAKCGSITKARKAFDIMQHQNVVSWNVMIAGYAMHGYSKDALELFELMKHSGTNPNDISFICILFACSHAGRVADGCKYFYLMSRIRT
ncbi:pentatricopeptide repeat-containing protein DOT4, chloroplastic isoform X2 [Cryptomeria japonica]|uniref:pentatricopeptide repeat-containing protein DOT4, chloroplastic isoform X2 n=1 Tax=Cryptomeria japonica TaxID=3369 RepID=UPI0027D9D69A|nr:pentatricopeptide repeat-containing protein DOT4, chloroplastic isoform X2 [Cryptomeria japonica]